MRTESMYIEKDAWDLNKKKPRFAQENPALWQKKIKKDRINIEIARRIIVEGVNNQITYNIMDFHNLKNIWTKLRSICSQFGQKVVYLIL